MVEDDVNVSFIDFFTQVLEEAFSLETFVAGGVDSKNSSVFFRSYDQLVRKLRDNAVKFSTDYTSEVVRSSLGGSLQFNEDILQWRFSPMLGTVHERVVFCKDINSAVVVKTTAHVDGNVEVDRVKRLMDEVVFPARFQTQCLLMGLLYQAVFSLRAHVAHVLQFPENQQHASNFYVAPKVGLMLECLFTILNVMREVVVLEGDSNFFDLILPGCATMLTLGRLSQWSEHVEFVQATKFALSV